MCTRERDRNDKINANIIMRAELEQEERGGQCGEKNCIEEWTAELEGSAGVLREAWEWIFAKGVLFASSGKRLDDREGKGQSWACACCACCA